MLVFSICSLILSFFVYSFSETERMDGGLLIEIHSKGLLKDKLLGVVWLPLNKILHSNKVCSILCFTLINLLIVNLFANVFTNFNGLLNMLAIHLN